MKQGKQKIYQFTLILKNVDEHTPGLEDSLYKAGCNDALINFRSGTVYLDFDRKATALENAVVSAIKDVESSSIKAIVASVAPEDLVTESEIAKRLNTNRQTVSLWIKGMRRNKHTFPKPVMKLSGRSPLWKWYEIVMWLYKNDIISEKEIISDAEFFEDINAVLEERDGKIKEARQALLQKLSNDSFERSVNQR